MTYAQTTNGSLMVAVVDEEGAIVSETPAFAELKGGVLHCMVRG